MSEKEFIDEQIDAIEQEIAKYSKLLFEAQGMFRLAVHLKKTCRIEFLKKEKENSTSRSAGQ